jgi:ABC-type Mn2+/Zn2+ transport system ATPase subunit
VAVGYGRKAVVTDVNLSVDRGSFVGLFGSNGSGKSTLLRTILGIIPPIRGTIHLPNANGRLPSLGYVPQRDRLDPVFLLSVFEVVRMGVYGRVGPGLPVNRPERHFVWECLRQTGVDNLARQRFSELSGGQLQRVLIARALASKPDLLLLDEPTAGIDSAASHSIMELLKHINQENGVAILLVTHDLASVRDYVHQVVWLADGRAVQGSTRELLNAETVQRMLNFPAL